MKEYKIKKNLKQFYFYQNKNKRRESFNISRAVKSRAEARWKMNSRISTHKIIEMEKNKIPRDQRENILEIR